MTLRDIADYLGHTGVQFMATIGLDGKPKVRPMQYMVMEDVHIPEHTRSFQA